MSLFRRSARVRADARGGIGDLITYFRSGRPHKFKIMAVSLVAGAGMFYAFASTFSWTPAYKQAEVTYVLPYADNRTLAEVHAQQARDLPAERAEKQAIAEAEARQRAAFARIDKKFHEIGIGTR